MNERIALSILMLTALLLLNSCVKMGDISMDDGKKADSRMEEIISAIKGNDAKALKTLFSKNAINEAVDIDKGVDYLFALSISDVDTWSREKMTGSRETRYGKKNLRLVSWYVIQTIHDKYLFIIIDYDTDTIDPDNAGLYTIFAIKEAEREMRYTYWQDIMIPGIWIPD